MHKKIFENSLKNLTINHAFGMAGLLFIQPNLSLITKEDIFKADEIVSDLATKINWGLQIEENAQNKAILEKAVKISEEEQEEFFEKLFDHFDLKYPL